MKKLSRKKRKHNKQNRIKNEERRKPEKIVGQGSQPLTQMIVKSVKGFEPTPVDQMFLIPAMGNKTPSVKNQLIILPDAYDQIKKGFDYGRSTAKNNVEQAGALYGYVYDTGEGIVGVVAAIHLMETIGESAYIEPTYEHWFGVHKHLDELNQKRSTPLYQIGWIHSHPNNIGIFMSGTDRETQKNYFYNKWQFAVVVCPQKETWGVFVGSDAEPCDGYFLTTNVYKKKEIKDDKYKKIKACK